MGVTRSAIPCGLNLSRTELLVPAWKAASWQKISLVRAMLFRNRLEAIADLTSAHQPGDRAAALIVRMQCLARYPLTLPPFHATAAAWRLPAALPS